MTQLKIALNFGSIVQLFSINSKLLIGDFGVFF
jgi:hypothetical protein